MHRGSTRRGAALGLAAAACLAVPTTHIAAAAAANPGPTPACGKGDVSQVVRTDHHRYAPGRPVTITVIARNRTSHNCSVPSTVRAAVHRPGAANLWESVVSIAWIREATFAPGKSVRYTFTWTQEDCSAQPCSAASPGTYVAEGGWGTYPAASTTLVINGVR